MTLLSNDLVIAIISVFALVVICIVAYVLERTLSTYNSIDRDDTNE